MAKKKPKPQVESTSPTSYTNETADEVHELTYPGCTYEVHPGETVEFPEGTAIRVRNKETGDVLISPDEEEE